MFFKSPVHHRLKVLKSHLLRERPRKPWSLTPSNPFFRDSVVLFDWRVTQGPCEVDALIYILQLRNGGGRHEVTDPRLYSQSVAARGIELSWNQSLFSFTMCYPALIFNLAFLHGLRCKPSKNWFCDLDNVLDISWFPTIIPLGICTFILQDKKPRLRKWNDLPKDPECEETESWDPKP